MTSRCAWPASDSLMIHYHDKEWGVPLHNDQKLFEFLVLDAAQAGLSWKTVLYKRENYRRAFHQFDPVKIVRYTEKDLQRLLVNPGIIRNRLKIQSALTNAQAFLDVKKDYRSFHAYIWQFVNHQPIQHRFKTLRDLPAKTAESDAMSKDMKKRGFSFAGSTICYAFMQAAGLVNDHTIDCYRHAYCASLAKKPI